MIEQFKALANDIRLLMIEWLKDPENNFPPQEHGSPKEFGVCVTHLQQKANLSPSTASSHLAILQRASLIRATRIGKWTYYRRDEDSIKEFIKEVSKGL